jgi:hypothetical protein
MDVEFALVSGSKEALKKGLLITSHRAGRATVTPSIDGLDDKGYTIDKMDHSHPG